MATYVHYAPDVRVSHGRRFHGMKSNYTLPNDDEEHTRLNYQHEAMKIMLDCNYTGPLPELNAGAGPKCILDIASGSGQWVLEIAQEFPLAKVIGIDLSEPGINQSKVPLNVSFIIGDITKPLPFQSESFDVVQMRVVPSIKEREEIYQEIHRVLQPKGIILLVEPAEHTSRIGTEPPAMLECAQAISRTGHCQATRKPAPHSAKTTMDDRSWPIATRIANDLRDSPSMWTNMHEEKVHIPVGLWLEDSAGQRAGKLLGHCATELIRAFRPAMIDEGVLTGDQIDEMIARFKKELEDGEKWQLETVYHFVWAEKLM